FEPERDRFCSSFGEVRLTQQVISTRQRKECLRLGSSAEELFGLADVHDPITRSVNNKESSRPFLKRRQGLMPFQVFKKFPADHKISAHNRDRRFAISFQRFTILGRQYAGYLFRYGRGGNCHNPLDLCETLGCQNRSRTTH